MKKSIALLFISFLFLFTACDKMEINAPDMLSEEEQKELDNMTGEAFLYEGDFNDGAHPTSGKAGIKQEMDGSFKLILSDFKSDPGPDLRLYIAENKNAKNFVEINNKVENGNLSYDLPSTVDLTKQKYVLIWCKAFSVNFGDAELVMVEN